VSSHLFLYVCLSALLATGCERPQDPDDLQRVLGAWTTANEPYTDRHFEITPEGQLHIGKGTAGIDVCQIESMDIEERSGFIFEYDLTYLDPQGVESSFVFALHEKEQVIRMLNQRGVLWRRTTP